MNRTFGGPAIFLDRSDINTDEIIPARYLTEVTKDALKPYLLEDLTLDGFDPQGEALQQATVMDHAAWQSEVEIKRPGVYWFVMEPKPYWEPAEDVFIIHYSKTVVAAFGEDEGWDEELGLKTEIVPLTKPFGLYQGNLFQGIVKVDGKPAAYAEVEIEYYNEAGTARAPSDYMITQTIKADKNGVFTYAAPKAGWWGFAALNPSDK